MTVRFINDSTALLSMRNSDFDAYSAFGEVVDNSIQANAKQIKVQLDYETTGRKNSYAVVKSIAFGDDGEGMSAEVLNHCMQLGYSTRYDDRSGIGRFGVGMTLAAINQCNRVEIYSKIKTGSWMWTYVDLKEITSKPPIMEHIPGPVERGIPDEYKKLVGEESGTLVIWGKYDRQPCSAYEMLKEMRIWFGRTYRMFIWDDVEIFLNGEIVKAIDPLYVKTDNTAFPDDPPGHEYTPMVIPWDVPAVDKPVGAPGKSNIEIRMSIVPEDFRPRVGAGDSTENVARCVDRNEGISILRNRREVFYGHIPWWPGAKFEQKDRYWGCEIAFDAVLDRAFTVKNIKRGAIPVPDLKQALKEQITPTRKSALEKVTEHWEVIKQGEKQQELDSEGEELITGHEEAESSAATAKTDTSTIDKHKDRTEEAKKLVEEVKKDESDQRKAAWALKFASQPYTILDDNWRGPDFMETNHLGGTDVIRYNCRHSFMDTLYKLMDLIESSDHSPATSRQLKNLIDLLLISYSKAEAKFESGETRQSEEFLESLRHNWGFYLKSYVENWLKDEDIQ